jgi:glycosyl transferase family 22 (putative mannosyltransferase)
MGGYYPSLSLQHFVTNPTQVSPFWTYFSRFLPRLLMVTNIFIAYGFYHNAHIRSLVRPAIGLVFLMSFLGQKEWRFVVYIVPMLNIAAAHGAQVVYAFFLSLDRIDEANSISKLVFASARGEFRAWSHF